MAIRLSAARLRRLVPGALLAAALAAGVAASPAWAATPAPTSTAVTSSVNPSRLGQAVSFTATVSGGTTRPTGQVSFIDYSTEEVLGRAYLDARGVATLTRNNFLVGNFFPGNHRVQARYDGDGTHEYSSSATYLHVVLPPGPDAVEVRGGEDLELNGTPARFFLRVVADGSAAEADCFVRPENGPAIRCTSAYDFRRNGSTVTFRGSALYDGRQPISFTATVVDGAPDSFTIFAAGRRYGGTVTSGDISVAPYGSSS